MISMKYVYILLITALAFHSKSQDSVRHYFDSGQLSCLEVKYPFENSSAGYREERVIVLNKNGDVVFNNLRRNYAGSASIALKFHDNGAVRQIRYSSQPDGGIQYYKAVYQLDTNGVITDKKVDKRDSLFDQPGIMHDRPKKEFIPNCPPMPSNECATLMKTQIGVVNKTGKKTRIKLQSSKNSDMAAALLRDGDTLRSKEIYTAEKFAEIHKTFKLEVAPRSSKKNFQSVELNSLPQLKLKENKQELYILYFLLD